MFKNINFETRSGVFFFAPELQLRLFLTGGISFNLIQCTVRIHFQNLHPNKYDTASWDAGFGSEIVNTLKSTMLP